MTRRFFDRPRLLLALSLAYVVAPGHPGLLLSGIPIGVAGLTLVVALCVFDAYRRSSDGRAVWAAFVLTALILAKVIVGVAAPPSGWMANYYANGDLSGPAETSTDFLGLGATRVDPAIAFSDTEFPVHFFNDPRFNHGFRREYTDPFSVRWTGHFTFDTAQPLSISLEARGEARLAIDSVEIASIESGPEAQRTRADVSLSSGAHVAVLSYRKAPDTEGLVRLSRITDGAERPWSEITSVPAPDRQRWSMAALSAAILLHLVAAGVIGVIFVIPFGRALTQAGNGTGAGLVDRLAVAAPAIVIAGLTAQGLWKVRLLVGHVWTLTAGDDWFSFEHEAREILINGLLMAEGAVIGRGQPFFYYPGYGYFVALVHRVVGESLAGVVLANFILLALATVLVFKLSQLLVGSRRALVALGWVLLVEQAAFTRYYTVTLLSENLFFFTTAVTVFCLTRFLVEGRRSDLLWSAAAGGVSALTRPSIMLMLPLVLPLILYAEAIRARKAPARAVATTLVFAALWMAVIVPATVRNYIVSSDPVLIAAGQAKTFVLFNLPSRDAKTYADAFQGTMGSAALTLARIAFDQPREFFSNLWIKAGFSLGMVHWMGDESRRPHPELIITSVLYLLALALVPRARSLEAMPLHLFILTHLATLMLTMPSNYGYRMILPMYLFMPVFAAALPIPGRRVSA